ncbi:MAG: cytochrome b [Gammaproteobacteria bacterium]|nr:cytochrome b [Gammaproteobacteria bacterium]
MLRNTRYSWGAIAKLLHWSMAALIFAQFALGWLAVSWRLSPTKLDLYVWHKSLGILLLVLVVLRLLWRWLNPTPAAPAFAPRWEHAAASANHFLLYALMLALPVTGWIINSAANVPFRIFWQWPLPAIVAPDKALEHLAKQAHLTLFIAISIVLVLHIAAALRHHFVKHNDILLRMSPFRGRKL